MPKMIITVRAVNGHKLTLRIGGVEYQATAYGVDERGDRHVRIAPGQAMLVERSIPFVCLPPAAGLGA